MANAIFPSNGLLYVPAEFKRRGHPDRLADSVASAAGGALLELDNAARFDIQVTVHFGPVHAGNGWGDTSLVLPPAPIVFICGQLGTIADRNAYEQKIESTVREVFRSVGYNSSNTFDPNDIHVVKSFNNQSADIAAGIEREGEKHGAGDATISIAYASSQTSSHLNSSHALALAVNQRLDAAFASGEIDGLQPDGKAQVEVGFSGREKSFPFGPKAASGIIVAAQHSAGVQRGKFVKSIQELVRSVNDIVLTPSGRRLDLVKKGTEIIVDGAGDFIIGGPVADTGVNGRMDSLYVSGSTRTYGGGLLVGRDVTKTDVSCLLSARFIAIQLVNGFAKDAEVKITYAIGSTEPESIIVSARGSRYSGQQLSDAVRKAFDLSPDGMKKSLGLGASDFASIAKNGFIGVPANGSHRWESVDEEKIRILRACLRRSASVAVTSPQSQKRIAQK